MEKQVGKTLLKIPLSEIDLLSKESVKSQTSRQDCAHNNCLTSRYTMTETQNSLQVFNQGLTPEEVVAIFLKDQDKLKDLVETVGQIMKESFGGEKQKNEEQFIIDDTSSSVTRISEAEMDSQERQLHAQVVMQPSIVPEDKPTLSVRSTNVPNNIALAVPTESPVNSPMMVSTEEFTDESSQFSNSKTSYDPFLYQNEASEDFISFCDMMNSPDCQIDEIFENSVALSEPEIHQPDIDFFVTEVKGDVLTQNKPAFFCPEQILQELNKFNTESPVTENNSTIDEEADEVHSIVSSMSPAEIEYLDKIADENMDIEDKDSKQASDLEYETQIPNQIMSDSLSWTYDVTNLPHIRETLVLDTNQTHNVPLKSSRKRCFVGTSDDVGKRMKKESPPIATARENKENFQVPQKENEKQNVAYAENPVYKMDSDGDLPLHIAVLQERKEEVKIIVQLMDGKMLDARNKKKQTPLHIALYVNNPEIIKILLNAGADPCITDSDGNNLMHLVCQNSLQVFYDIWKHKMIDPQKYVSMMTARNYDGLTPMHIAVQRNNAKMFELLLEEKFDLNVKEMKTGSTPLIEALQRSNWKMAQTLIDHGADINIPTNSGRYPLDFVLTTSNLKLATDLLKREAESGVKTEYTCKEMKNLFETEMRKRRRKKTTK